MEYKELKEVINLPKYSNTDSLYVDNCRSNVVSNEKLQRVQLKTLNLLSEFLSKTYGPMGSNTKILSGNDDKTIMAEYSKDGHKVLKHIVFSNPIEMAIKSEIVDITQHVELEVGDGTTSAVILAANIYKRILGIIDDGNYPPYQVVYTFKKIVGDIQKEIMTHKKVINTKDIYDICMVSTNANEEVSRNIAGIYRDFGFDVQLDVSISPTKDSMIKVYDGLTLTEGYSDPAYINNTKNGTCELHNPKVYMFMDPIDDMNMISLFEKIIVDNIIDPLNSNEDMIPTVIVSPKMSGDMSALMKQVIDVMNKCEANQKPPLLVITNILGTADEEIALDITQLCGCKYIKKYIDPKIKEMDEAKGLAPTLENISKDFGGSCELVVADIAKTKFVNPSQMYSNDEDENGNKVYSDTYNSLHNFLKAEYEHAKSNGEDDRSVNKMRKRLRSLESNMVEYFVGGISIGDRDSVKDLVEDAVKSCASACENGLGWAANFEGLRASKKVVEDNVSSNVNLTKYLAYAIYDSYVETAATLYQTIGLSNEEIDDTIEQSLENGEPFNIRSKEFDGRVKTSIMTDVKILEAISKIITIMVTSNQCLLQAPQLNNY